MDLAAGRTRGNGNHRTAFHAMVQVTRLDRPLQRPLLFDQKGKMPEDALHTCGIYVGSSTLSRDSNSCASRVVTVLSLSEAEPLKALVGLFGAVAAGAIMDHGVQLTQGCRQQSECRHEST